MNNANTKAVRQATGRRFGRLPKETDGTNFKSSPLYKLLFDAFPQFHKKYRDGSVELSLCNLAEHLDVSRNVIYRWCNGLTRMRSTTAESIIQKSNGRVKKQDLIDILF